MNRTDDVRFCPRHKFDVWQIDGRAQRPLVMVSPDRDVKLAVRLLARSCRLRQVKWKEDDDDDDEDEEEEEKEARWSGGEWSRDRKRAQSPKL